LNSEVTKIEPEEDTLKECEEEDQTNFLTPVQRIYASNRVIIFFFNSLLTTGSELYVLKISEIFI